MMFQSILILILVVISCSMAAPTLRLVNGELAQNHIDHGTGVWIDGVGNVTHDRFGVDRTISGNVFVTDLQELAIASTQQMQANGYQYNNGAWSSVNGVNSMYASAEYQQLVQMASSGNTNAQQQLAQLMSQASNGMYNSNSFSQQMAQLGQLNQYGNNLGNNAYNQWLASQGQYGAQSGYNNMYGNTNGLYNGNQANMNGLYNGNQANMNGLYNGNQANMNGMYDAYANAQQMGQTNMNSDSAWLAYQQQQMAQANGMYNSNGFGQQYGQMNGNSASMLAQQAAQAAQMAGIGNTGYGLSAADQVAQMAQANLVGANNVMNSGVNVAAADQIAQMAQANMIAANNIQGNM